MDIQRPVKEKETGKWIVWAFAYEEDGKRFYEKLEFWEFSEAIAWWKKHNTPEQIKRKK